MLLGDLIVHNTRRFPDKEGVVCEEKRFTWHQVNQRVNQLAHALSELGMAKGDRVAILSGNSHQYWETYCSGGKAGSYWFR